MVKRSKVISNKISKENNNLIKRTNRKNKEKLTGMTLNNEHY